MHTGTNVDVKNRMSTQTAKVNLSGLLASVASVGALSGQYARRTLQVFLAILFQMHLFCGVQSLLIFLIFYLALTCFKGAALRNLDHLERFSEVTPLFWGRGERQVNHLLTPCSYYWHKAPALLNFLFGAT